MADKHGKYPVTTAITTTTTVTIATTTATKKAKKSEISSDSCAIAMYFKATIMAIAWIPVGLHCKLSSSPVARILSWSLPVSKYIVFFHYDKKLLWYDTVLVFRAAMCSMLGVSRLSGIRYAKKELVALSSFWFSLLSQYNHFDWNDSLSTSKSVKGNQ